MNAQEKLATLGFHGRAAQAAALVVDAGVSRQAAAKAVGVDPAAVTRLLNKVTETTICPCCGHVKKEIKL